MKLRNRNIVIDVSKGVAIILVVIGHVIQFGTSGEGFWDNNLFKIIYSFHMPLFIFLSGYVSAKGIVERSFSNTIKKRFKTLIVPFLSWGVIMYFYSLLGKFVLKGQAETNFLKYIISVILNPDTGLWFLWVLFFLTLPASAIAKSKYNIVISVILYFVILAIPLNDLFSIYMIKWLYPFFFSGVYLSIHKQKLIKFIKPTSITLSIAFPILLLWWDKNDYVYITK